MNRLAKAHQRLQEAGDLAAVIAAAHEGFVAALTALRAREDPDSAWFGEFVMAAVTAPPLNIGGECDGLLGAYASAHANRVRELAAKLTTTRSALVRHWRSIFG